MIEIPPARPVIWPLRPASTAHVTDDILPDGRRRISVRHAPLEGVTPQMLNWWYGHVDGDMTYAGRTMKRYLVWHPLDHIFYRTSRLGEDGSVGPGSRLEIAEAFGRDPNKLLHIRVDVVKRDAEGATIISRVLGMTVVELVNSFEAGAAATGYTSTMTIGTAAWPGRLGLNALLRRRILPGAMGHDWARHHIEEIGNLVNFLPALHADYMVSARAR